MKDEPYLLVSRAFDATPASIDHVHDALNALWREAESWPAEGLRDPSWQASFVTAVAEIAANIIRHAHPPGYVAPPVRLVLQLHHDRLVALFEDFGVPYTAWRPHPEPMPTAAADLAPPLDLLVLPEGGMGLSLARGLVDQLDYDRSPDGANHWSLSKILPIRS